MDELASKLVDEFIQTGKKQYSKSYNLTRQDKRTGEKVLVLVLKIESDKEDTILTFTKEIQRAVAGPKGNPCPCCGGSGKA